MYQLAENWQGGLQSNLLWRDLHTNPLSRDWERISIRLEISAAEDQRMEGGEMRLLAFCFYQFCSDFYGEKISNSILKDLDPEDIL